MNKSILLLFLVILKLNQVHSQVSVTYFPFQSIVGVSTITTKRLWFDFKTETNTFASNINMELSPKINYKINNYSYFYLGSGLGFNPSRIAESDWINGYFIDWGARLMPLKKETRFQIVFELSPYVNRTFSGGNLRSRLGLSWNFPSHIKPSMK